MRLIRDRRHGFLISLHIGNFADTKPQAMKKSSRNAVKARLTMVRAALVRAEVNTFEVSPARNALILALAHVRDAQRHVRTFTRLTGRTI
jgi:hypothetical protein